MNASMKELSVKELRRICNPEFFEFTSTAEVSTLNEVVGQERAVRAVSFGQSEKSPENGRGRLETVS